ncbi:hypothetical protein [Infirmifilum sp. SLHALR2]
MSLLYLDGAGSFRLIRLCNRGLGLNGSNLGSGWALPYQTTKSHVELKRVSLLEKADSEEQSCS